MIHLVLGGARSGKSRFAEQWVEKLAPDEQKLVYIATATPDDAEMEKRISRHQSDRSQKWQTIEEPKYLSALLTQLNEKPNKIILIDCLTLYLSNWLCFEEQNAWKIEKQNFIAALKQSKNRILVVSNEVGSGIVPLGELSREFVDQAGWLNQSIAQLAEEVTLVVAGLPVLLKQKSQY